VTMTQGCHNEAAATTVAAVDLHQWMLSDFAAMRSKLFDSVIRLVHPDRWHEQADGAGSTLAGLLLHVARHQDLAVNAVIRNHEPLFIAHRAQLGLAELRPEVGLAEAEDRAATALVEPDALLHYLTDVFDQTRDWLEPLGSLALDIEPNTAYRLTHRGGLDADEVPWLYSGWEGKALWWLVQWPVIGHGHAHVGEAISIRNRMGLSPF
jgi:hypothetical protein